MTALEILEACPHCVCNSLDFDSDCSCMKHPCRDCALRAVQVAKEEERAECEQVARKWAAELQSVAASEAECGDHAAAESYGPRVAVAVSIANGIRARKERGG